MLRLSPVAAGCRVSRTLRQPAELVARQHSQCTGLPHRWPVTAHDFVNSHCPARQT
jgi:hypothetical protein